MTLFLNLSIKNNQTIKYGQTELTGSRRVKHRNKWSDGVRREESGFFSRFLIL